jgi:hypothetical protein
VVPTRKCESRHQGFGEVNSIFGTEDGDIKFLPISPHGLTTQETQPPYSMWGPQIWHCLHLQFEQSALKWRKCVHPIRWHLSTNVQPCSLTSATLFQLQNLWYGVEWASGTIMNAKRLSIWKHVVMSFKADHPGIHLQWLRNTMVVFNKVNR